MERPTPPAKITVLYRNIGTGHVFTSPDLDGLHVVRSELKPAYELLLTLVSALLHRRIGGPKVKYHFAKGFDAFAKAARQRNPLIPTEIVLSRVKRATPTRRAREPIAA